MNDLDALLILNAIPGLTPLRIKKLIQLFGSARCVLALSAGELLESGILPSQIVENIQQFPKDNYLKKEYNLLYSYDVQVIDLWNEKYPVLLKEISDPPVLLYVKGNPDLLNFPSIALVGSRRCSPYGLTMARKFAGSLGEAGFNIVSGLAKGIDTAAHQGALKAKATTVAVLGSGLAEIYPTENKKLAEEIGRQGALVSEFPMEAPPIPYHFPQRNRIISGLSLGVVVVEASEKSGALITSDFALNQGREVFAIPGPIDQPTSFGGHRLIKEGAKLVNCVEDILEELKVPIKQFSQGKSVRDIFQNIEEKTFELTNEEDRVYQNLSGEPVSLEYLAEQSGLPVQKILSVLLSLELKEAIKTLPGKFYIRLSTCVS